MDRVAGFAQRHHRIALVAWLIVLTGVTAVARVAGDDYSNGSDLGLPGTQSQELADLLEEHAPDMSGDSVTVVVHDRRGWDAAVDLHALIDDLGAVDRVEAVTPPGALPGTVSPDGTVGLMDVALEGARGSADTATYEEIIGIAEAHAVDGIRVDVAGQGIRKSQQGEGMGAEAAGLLAALVILVLMFGSFLAASLPLLTALFAVGTALALVTFLSHLISVPDYTTALPVLIGLGVGIDYALLLFTRLRSELLSGASWTVATSKALDTAGRAVLFAGLSVILALLGLVVLDIPAYQGVVAAVILTVLVTMVASLSLLPGLLALFGPRLERRVREHARKARREPGSRWRQWGRLVQRHPVGALVVSVLALGALTAPALELQLGFNDAGNDPESSTTRAAYDLVSEKFGPGANGPLLVVTEGSSAEAQAAYDHLRRDDRIVGERLTPPMPVADGVHLMRVEPTTGPQDHATADLVTDLRADLGDANLVGGATAASVDYAEAIADRFWLFVTAVVGLAFALLLCVFRSLLIPIKAAVLNILSIGAAMGAMKLVFQDGRLWAEAGPIEAFVPVFIFAIVFGLSMDYEVFLLARIREIWVATGDAQHAVREGLAHTGGVITAAAAVMVVVFGSFALFPDRMLAQTGFAMAIAILLDAVVIRCLMVPAAMRLFGERAWWLPGWLDRLLPQLQVEGHSTLEAGGDVAASPAPEPTR
ncbi:MMPL family transporter [Nocardioides sp. SYSU DS0651]|uniref:MMPL family transporter n=1 Tax=Nocardioides sp. SYSU DS0651 TaxID=3415955 RepID=UPI003F4B4C7B